MPIPLFALIPPSLSGAQHQIRFLAGISVDARFRTRFPWIPDNASFEWPSSTRPWTALRLLFFIAWLPMMHRMSFVICELAARLVRTWRYRCLDFIHVCGAHARRLVFRRNNKSDIYPNPHRDCYTGPAKQSVKLGIQYHC